MVLQNQNLIHGNNWINPIAGMRIGLKPPMPQPAGGFSPILLLAVGFNRRKRSGKEAQIYHTYGIANPQINTPPKYTTHMVLHSPKNRRTFAPDFKTKNKQQK
jgi:hypothetical protein